MHTGNNMDFFAPISRNIPDDLKSLLTYAVITVVFVVGLLILLPAGLLYLLRDLMGLSDFGASIITSFTVILSVMIPLSMVSK